MKPIRVFSLILVAALAAAFCVLPVMAVAPDATTAAASASVTAGKPFVSATVSAATVTAGTPVTVSGVSVGPGNSVQIWVFAGNYVNVSTVPVNPADNTYAKTYDTTGLPAATYYVFVQNPGADNALGITTDGYAGTVVDKNGTTLFKFSGAGSLQGNDAAEALTYALNDQGGDDIYTKTQFAITASAAASATTGVLVGGDRDAHGCIGSAGYTWCEAKQKCLRSWEEPCEGTAAATSAPAAATTTAKSPVPAGIAIAALAGACAIAAARKMR
jgi:hypothetical protein